MHPIVTRRGMAATSHPLATRAAVRMLEQGGNAVDAAIAAAAVLCVCEPMSTGVGGDCFALLWRDGALRGLNASGPAPRRADPDLLDGVVAVTGPRSVTVPGAVAGWQLLAETEGRVGLDRCLHAAIDAAERGFAVTPAVAAAWREPIDAAAFGDLARLITPAPRVGDTRAFPALAATLRRIASDGRDGFYTGPVADAVCAACWLDPDDLADFRPEWVEPLATSFGDATVIELPPNGQGAAALQALAILNGLPADVDDTDRVHFQAEAMKLAFADAYRYIGDAPLPLGYLDASYIARRRALVDPHQAGEPGPGMLVDAGTVYLCVVDEDRSACSFIQSLYDAWGSRVVAGGTGVILHNRGACFTLEPGHPNRLTPGRRPFHTIIPGLLLRDQTLMGPFGVMGGHVQPQGHLQLVAHLIRRGLDPQAALAEPRWRLDQTPQGWQLFLEPGLWHTTDALRRRGHRVTPDPARSRFGGGQCIIVSGEALIGGSEPRKDGQAAGY